MVTRKKGNAGEEAAAAFLAQKGMRIVMRNFRVRQGEIDIIALDAGVIVFVEVKTSSMYGLSELPRIVDQKKRRKIIETAKFFLLTHREYSDMPVRFDIVFLSADREKSEKNARETAVFGDGAARERFIFTHLAGAFGDSV